MTRKEALFEILKGHKMKRCCWVKGAYVFEENGTIFLWSPTLNKKAPLDMNGEPYHDWEFAYPEVKATYKDAIKAFSEGKAIKDPDGKVHQIDAYAKENEGECYTIID